MGPLLAIDRTPCRGRELLGRCGEDVEGCPGRITAVSAPKRELLALAAGWWGLRDVLRRPVVETLRRAAV